MSKSLEQMFERMLGTAAGEGETKATELAVGPVRIKTHLRAISVITTTTVEKTRSVFRFGPNQDDPERG